MRILATLAILLLVITRAVAADSIRFGKRLVMIGDDMAKVYSIAGPPDRMVPIRNPFGGAYDSVRMDYQRERKVIGLVFDRDERLIRIVEER